MINDARCPEWILPESVRVSEVLKGKALKEVPFFKENSKCCAIHHSKVNYFSNCNMKDRRVEIPLEIGEDCHDWQERDRNV